MATRAFGHVVTLDALYRPSFLHGTIEAVEEDAIPERRGGTYEQAAAVTRSDGEGREGCGGSGREVDKVS